MDSNEAWASFCISTYRRPELLKKQLALLLDQTFTKFCIIISDNDPDASARNIAESFNDSRIKYHNNGTDLGMIKSFNKSIERASSEFIVMVTDDDPVEKNFLQEFHRLHSDYPGYSIYCGFQRKNTKPGDIELISKEKFIPEILNPKKTPKILWSSCIMRRETVLKLGKIPDYGSPHLADHALIGIVGSADGSLIINKMFSSLTSHNSNFSKSHLEMYLSGCLGFYRFLMEYNTGEKNYIQVKQTIDKHLGSWFISSFFNLKKYYTKKKDSASLKEIDHFAIKILKLPFMTNLKVRFYTKQFIFQIKKRMNLLN